MNVQNEWDGVQGHIKNLNQDKGFNIIIEHCENKMVKHLEELLAAKDHVDMLQAQANYNALKEIVSNFKITE